MTHPFQGSAGAVGLPSPDFSTVCYSIEADSDPGMLSRVLEPVAKRGRIVDKLHALLDDGPDPVMLIDFQVRDLDPHDSQIIGAVLGQIVGVRRVLICDKAAGPQSG